MTTAPAAPQQTAGPVLGAWQPLPNAGAHHQTAPHHTPTVKLYRGLTAPEWAIRIVLGLVMTAALAVGTWSIYTLLTHKLGAPNFIGYFGCGMFDVAALFFALLSQQYAVTTDSGLAPRLAMLAMVSTSSWVNWNHGQMEGWGTVGSVILAAAPVIAELAFEMFHRFAHRETLRRLGRVAQTLPVLGKWAWLAHPRRSRKTIDAHIRAALTEHEAVADRREEVAAVRAQAIVSVPLSSVAIERMESATPDALTLNQSPLTPALNTLTDSAHAPLTGDAQPALTAPQPSAPATSAHARAAEPSAPARSERAHPKPRSPRTTSNDAHERAQSAPSIVDRKALRTQQDALTLKLYETLNGRPEWTEIVETLVSAGLERVSRATAQRIRERVEDAHPELPRERRTNQTAAR